MTTTNGTRSKTPKNNSVSTEVTPMVVKPIAGLIGTKSITTVNKPSTSVTTSANDAIKRIGSKPAISIKIDEDTEFFF